VVNGKGKEGGLPLNNRLEGLGSVVSSPQRNLGFSEAPTEKNNTF